MTSQGLKHAIFILGLMMIAGTSERAFAAEPDWKAVESALGKSGQTQPGGVFRIGMPRTDLTVTVKGVPVKAGFAPRIVRRVQAGGRTGDGDGRPRAPRSGGACRDGGPVQRRARESPPSTTT